MLATNRITLDEQWVLHPESDIQELPGEAGLSSVTLQEVGSWSGTTRTNHFVVSVPTYSLSAKYRAEVSFV